MTKTPCQPRLLYSLLAGAALLLLVGWVYLPTLDNGFHFDDYPNIVEAYPLHLDSLTFAKVGHALENAALPNRPLSNLTVIIDWWRGAGDPETFQQTNLLLHLCTTLLVFLLLPLVMRPLAPGISRVWLLIGAALFAALWALHPIQTQSVTYIVQRMAGLAALFSLLSCYGYLRARLAAGWSRWLWLSVALLGAIAGVLSKENAWIIPALWWLLEYGVIRHQKPLVNISLDRWLLALPFVAGVVLIADLYLQGPLTSPYVSIYELRDFTLQERLLTQPRVFLFHLSQIFWPIPERFSLFHDFELSSTLVEPTSTWIALLFVLGWCGLGLWLLVQQQWRVFGAMLLWLPVTLLIESSFIPLEMVFEHRMYLPTVGLVGLLVGLFYLLCMRLGQVAWFGGVGLSLVLVLFLGWATTERLVEWRTDQSLYLSAVENAPLDARAQYKLASVLAEQGDLAEAVRHYQRAIELAPDDLNYQINLANLLARMGQSVQAVEYYQAVVAQQPENYHALGGWAQLEEKLGRFQQAEALYHQAIQSDPYNERAYLRLARLLSQEGKQDAALTLLTGAVSKSRGNPFIQNELGLMLIRYGDLDAARRRFELAVKTYPAYAEAYSNLGGVLIQIGQFQSGREALQFALKLNPSLLQARRNLQALEQHLNSRRSGQ